MIYVFCPYALVTGGPDALHQLVYYLKKANFSASIVYCDIKTKKYEIPKPYQAYVMEYDLLEEIEDDEKNILVIPETLWFYAKKFNKCKRYIWRLSVNNNTEKTNLISKIFIIFKKVFSKKFFKVLIKKPNKIQYLLNFFRNKRYDFTENVFDLHLCASYYAYDYVSSYTEKCRIFIEPISLSFLSNIPENHGKFLQRKNIVLYNPAKNYKFTKKVLKSDSFTNIKFIPLKGYSQKELCELYQSSKLYIDFGTFPGAERIPKEAVINGCNILTGRNGASNFYGDVPIKDEYKIDSIDKNISIIQTKIVSMINSYEQIFNDFDEYRKTVENLEDNFMKDINILFKGN